MIAKNFQFSAGEGVEYGVGDDAAVLSPPANSRLAFSSDTLIEGVHFFADMKATDLAYKAAAVSLSDLAAMGARALWLSVALTTPTTTSSEWFASFAHGLNESTRQYAYSVVGGDLTNGGVVSVTTNAIGAITDKPLLRSGAKIGDDLWLSGSIGAAALAVAFKRGDLPSSLTAQITQTTIDAAMRRLNRPTARICLGQKIASVANSAIDLSDGLAAAAADIAKASSLRLLLESSFLPAEEGMEFLPPELRLNFMLNGGDDYELLFSAPPEQREFLHQAVANLKTQIIGKVVDGQGVFVVDENGALIEAPTGYEHNFGD